jgi:acyl-CoA reductase-like NAD-dependent aldehyde dehydrogenase
MGEVLSDAPHLPKGAFSVLPCSRDGADLFTTDDRFKLLSFTGSPSVRAMRLGLSCFLSLYAHLGARPQLQI